MKENTNDVKLQRGTEIVSLLCLIAVGSAVAEEDRRQVSYF